MYRFLLIKKKGWSYNYVVYVCSIYYSVMLYDFVCAHVHVHCMSWYKYMYMLYSVARWSSVVFCRAYIVYRHN